MAAIKKSVLTRPYKKSKSDKKNIRIRMYRVGFGDCFLLSIPAKIRPHVIIFLLIAEFIHKET
jgi:hypothetical protein